MRHGDLSGRVTWSGLAAVIALSAVAGWAAGVEGAAGVAGGGAGALLNFRRLASSVAGRADWEAGSRRAPGIRCQTL